MTSPSHRASFALTIVAALLVSACAGSSTWNAPKVVRIESKDALGVLMPTWLNWLSDAPEGQPQALLLRDGDLIFGSSAPFRYLASDGTSIKVVADRSTARIGETVVTVGLSEADGRTWLNKATENQLKGLRMIGIPKEIDAELMASLRRLASTNPSIDLLFDDEAAVLEVLPIFKPRCVFLPDEMKAATLGALATQPQIETVLLKAEEPGALDVLVKLPKLTRLVLGEWSPSKTGPLPAGLNSLRSLIIAGGDDLKDLSALKNLPDQLEELSVLATKGLTDITGLSRFTRLTTLLLNLDDGIGDLSGLSGQQNLRWVGVPSKTTQEQFAGFVSAHPDLAILDLSGNSNISSMAPLASLKGLEGLILHGPYENMSALHSLRALKFLGISKKVFDESPEQIAALKAALPDALVVRVSPFCLGSGWILLLLPVLALTAWMARRRMSGRLAA